MDPELPPTLPTRDIVRGELVIRRYRSEDAEALNQAISESADHLRPWMEWVHEGEQPLAERREFLERSDAGWENGGDMNFGIFRDGVVVGGCGLHRRRGPRCLEIGYWIHADHIGKGYATTAAEALTSAAFTLSDVDYVEIHHDEANVRSRKVPQKLGYELVAVQPDRKGAPAEAGMDCTWRMLRKDWHGEPAWPAA